MSPAELSVAAAARYHTFLIRLRELVAIDSGSRELAGLRQMANLTARYATGAGMTVQRRPLTDDGDPLGDVVIARLPGTGSGRILLVAHMDTVFPPGTAAARPFRIDGHRAYGPGVCDDAAGLLAGIAAIGILADGGRTAFEEIVMVATPDEEIGAPGSRPVLAELGKDATAILCLECARENGDLVTARKGVADVHIDLRGRAAHAGIEPERGANAALAAAHLTVALQQLNGRWPGATVNVGILDAGTRPNVVADRARLVADLRAADTHSYDEIVRAIEAIAHNCPIDGVTASVRLVAPSPPWSGGPGTNLLLSLATEVGAGLGLTVTHAATGGSADANLLALSGVPVLDGLGPVGGGDHGPDEWLDLGSIVPRVALLAGLIQRIGAVLG